MAEPSDAKFEKQLILARKRGGDRLSGVLAKTVAYDRSRNRIVITLNGGVEVSFDPSAAEGLADATPEALTNIELTPFGTGIHFPDLDADIYVPALLEGLLGSRRWMASSLGSSGGRAKSSAKIEAARENGKLGGRPKKNAA